MPPHARRYRLLAWASLWFTVVVVLGGAVVRASGSGDGCGETWPRCEGSLIPLGGGAETAIEFAHRSLTLVLGVVLVWFGWVTWRRVESGHPVRRWTMWAAIFFAGEVAIGAVLVVFGWVDTDQSLGRLVAVPIHLVNTFLLLAALAGAAFHAGRPAPDVRWPDRRSRGYLAAALGILLVVAAMGALNALADTLHEADSLAEGVAADFDPDSPLLVQLRIYHPMVAIIGGLALVWLMRHPLVDTENRAGRLRALITGVVFLQFAIGIVNVVLLTPIELQVVHLLTADVLWIASVLSALTVSRGFAERPVAGAVTA